MTTRLLRRAVGGLPDVEVVVTVPIPVLRVLGERAAPGYGVTRMPSEDAETWADELELIGLR